MGDLGSLNNVKLSNRKYLSWNVDIANVQLLEILLPSG